MTHEHFCIWLDGFLEGNTDMDLDLRDKLREKLGSIGTVAPKKQASADVPKTASPDDYFKGGLVSGVTPRGGLSGPFIAHDLLLRTDSIGAVAPSLVMNAVNSVTAAASSANTAISDSSLARLSAAARACE